MSKRRFRKSPWTETEINYLEKYFKSTKLRVLSAVFERSLNDIRSKAKELKLVRDKRQKLTPLEELTRSRWRSNIKYAALSPRKNNTARKTLFFDPKLVESYEYFVECVGNAPSLKSVLRLHDRSLGYVPQNIFWVDKDLVHPCPSFEDLSGQRFGHWRVIGGYHIKTHSNGYWVCQCDCGAIHHRSGKLLKGNRTKGCPKCVAKDREENKRLKRKPRSDMVPERSAYQRWRVVYLRWWRGKIDVCDDALVRSFKTFMKEVGPMPSPTCCITLLQPSSGYVRDNIVWTESVAP